MFKIAFTATLLAFFPPLEAKSETLSQLRGRYVIEASSEIGFLVSQLGGGGVKGSFRRFSGIFNLMPGNTARSSVTFSLEPASVETGQTRVEDFLKSSAVFSAREHPLIRFRSTRVRQDGPDSAIIEGVLTARGITRRETFHAKLAGWQGRNVRFQVTGDILRSPYGMDVGTPIYADRVHFEMTLTGKRK